MSNERKQGAIEEARRGGNRVGAVPGRSYFNVASRIRRPACSGVGGIARSVTPREASAALTTAAGAPIEPASSQPLAPGGLWVQG
jgi:hypothetical protein